MNLKRIRNEYGVTQKELAEMLGVQQGMISLIETGRAKPSPELAAKIGEVFNLGSAEIWETFYATDNQMLSSP